MSDFFKELEEDIREERMLNLWRKYGNYIIGLAVAIVIGTAAYTIWSYFKHQTKLKAHVSFSEAVSLMKQGKNEDALKAFQALALKGGGYGKISQLYEAALLPNPEALYTKISKENASDPALGNLPTLLKASRDLDNPEILASLESLTAPNNAWAPLAFELLAFNNLKRGDQAKAAAQYIKILKEPYASANEQLRASLMLSQMDVPPYVLEEELKKEAQP